MQTIQQTYQNPVAHKAIFPPQVEQMLPVLTSLNLEQKLSLINLLTNNPSVNQSDEEKHISQRKMSPIGRNYLGKVWMSDDFDEPLTVSLFRKR